MSEIIFSHKKHTVWNGCELCHPEIFNIQKKTTKHFELKMNLAGEFWRRLPPDGRVSNG